MFERSHEVQMLHHATHKVLNGRNERRQKRTVRSERVEPRLIIGDFNMREVENVKHVIFVNRPRQNHKTVRTKRNVIHRNPRSRSVRNRPRTGGRRVNRRRRRRRTRRRWTRRRART
jgi:hypothetical protein